mgnify:CR=1 FL=1
MIQLPDALKILDDAARAFPVEMVSTDSAAGRLLTETLVTPTDVPAFPRSAMDGFAVRRDDMEAARTGRALQVLETVAAGQTPRETLRPGTAIQVMTGAEVPAEAELVVRVEYAEQSKGRVRFSNIETGSNIIRRGENARAGDAVVSPRLLQVHDVGVAAAHGYRELPVLQAPRVAVLSTGDELKEPGESLGPGEIYNSNAYQLLAHLRRYGCAPSYYGIARDDPEALGARLAQALPESDMLILSGGVSKGEYDYVPKLLAEQGVETRFHRVAMKPGRPTFFGTRDRERAGAGGRQYIFGLPGNPVSTYVAFEVFVRRLLYRLAGIDPAVPGFPVSLGSDLEHKDPARAEFVPVAIRGDEALPVRYGGSSHLSALSTADGLVEIAVGTGRLEKGTRVHVRPL